MDQNQPLSIVIRIPNVSISRRDLEVALQTPVDRYEPRQDNALAYAQIDVPEERDHWDAAFDLIQSIHDPMLRLMSERLVGSPCLDVAIGFASSALSTSFVIPPHVAMAVGKTGLDIDVSIYRTEKA